MSRPSLPKFARSIFAIRILSIRDLGRLAECVSEDMDSDGESSADE